MPNGSGASSLGGPLVNAIFASVIGALVALAGTALVLAPRVARLEAQVVTLTKATDQLIELHISAREGQLVIPRRRN